MKQTDLVKDYNFPSLKIRARPKIVKATKFTQATLIIGYRIGGEIGVQGAMKTITFEVEELGNTAMVDYIAKALDCAPLLKEVEYKIASLWGPKAKAVWLCKSKADCIRIYGEGQSEEDVSTVTLPINAKVVCDLEDEGQLWIYSGEEQWQ